MARAVLLSLTPVGVASAGLAWRRRQGVANFFQALSQQHPAGLQGLILSVGIVGMCGLSLAFPLLIWHCRAVLAASSEAVRLWLLGVVAVAAALWNARCLGTRFFNGLRKHFPTKTTLVFLQLNLAIAGMAILSGTLPYLVWHCRAVLVASPEASRHVLLAGLPVALLGVLGSLSKRKRTILKEGKPSKASFFKFLIFCLVAAGAWAFLALPPGRRTFGSLCRAPGLQKMWSAPTGMWMQALALMFTLVLMKVFLDRFLQRRKRRSVTKHAPWQCSSVTSVTPESFRKLRPTSQREIEKILGQTDFESPDAGDALAEHLCHMLKVGHPWTSFVEKLRAHKFFQGKEAKPTITSLFLWLLQNSSEEVRAHLLRAHMAQNPVPVSTAWPKPRFCQELLWSLPQRPVLVSFKTSEVHGVSELLNSLFDTNFAEWGSQLGDESMAFCEMQSDADIKAPGRGFAVMDVHGQVPASLLQSLTDGCHYCMLHTTAKDFHTAEMTKSIDRLISKPECFKVFVLVWDDQCLHADNTDPPKKLEANEKKVTCLRIPYRPASGSSYPPSDIGCLKRMIYEALPSLSSSPHVMLNVMGMPEPKVWATLQTIARGCAEACVDDEGMQRKKVFPMIASYKELCQVEREIREAQKNDDRHAANRFKAERDALQQKRKKQDPSDVTNKFVDVLVAESREAHLQQLARYMHWEFEAHGMLPVHAQLAMASLHKEAIQITCHSTKMRSADCVKQAYAELICNGMPFELLDGEDLYLEEDFLRCIFEVLAPRWQGKRFEVRSTVGPQSSGKSTLNNCRYGGGFAVSEGRCSRGVYAEFHEAEEVVVLVLDTEGLQSPEKASPEFDRLMMLFTLAVSNRVDIIVKGMMSEPFKRLVEICVRAWSDLQVAKVPDPQLTWIMNQVADPDPKHHEDCFKQIVEELKGVFLPEELGAVQEFLRLGGVAQNSDALKVVPSMYNENKFLTLGPQNLGEWTRLSINENFSEACARMTAASFSAGKGGQVLGLLQWLDMAKSIFDTIRSYPDLTYFADIRQIQLKKSLTQWITDNMNRLFRNVEARKKHLQRRRAIAETKPTHESIHSVQVAVDTAFDEAMGDVKERFTKELQESKADGEFCEEMRRMLNAELEVQRSEWQRDATLHMQNKSVSRAIEQGHERLRAEVQKLSRNPGTMKSHDDAKEHFQKLWKHIIEEMMQKFPRDEFESDLFSSTYKLYPLEGKPGQETVRHILEEWENLPKDVKLSDVPALACGPRLFRNASKALESAPLAKPLSADFKTLWQSGLQKVAKAVEQNLPEDNLPSQRSMQAVNEAVREVAAHLDTQLEELECKLSRWGYGYLISSAIIQAWRTMKTAAWTTHMQDINKFKEQKDQQEDYFCSLVLNDSRADKLQATRWVEDIVGKLIGTCSDVVQQRFQHDLCSVKPQLDRQSVQAYLDEMLGSDLSNTWDTQEHYITDPASALTDEFDKRWDSSLAKPAKKTQKEMTRNHRRGLSFLRDALKDLRDKHSLQVTSAQSDQLFKAVTKIADTPTKTQLALRQVLGEWLALYLTEDCLPAGWSKDDGDTGRFLPSPSGADPIITCDDGLPRKGSPVTADCCSDLLELLKVVPLDAIGNLHAFTEAAVQKLDSILSSEKNLEQRVVDKTRQFMLPEKRSLKDMLVPCNCRCPCCGRLCDNLQPGHTKHTCLGHLPRGFKGNYISDGQKTASTLMCTEMKDAAIILYNENGEEKASTWQVYKQKHLSWELPNQLDSDQAELEGRFLQAWKRVGPRFCEKYGIRFTEHGEQGLLLGAASHYLLILDSSSSMRGGKWSDVEKALGELLEKAHGSQHRFSVIKFNDSAKAPAVYSTSSEILEQLNKGSFSVAIDGATSFTAAFKCATGLEMPQEDSCCHARTIAVFMSDGEDNRNQEGLDSAMQAFKNAYKQMPMKFYSIAFGNEADEERLQLIAQNMAGEFIQTVDGVELQAAFAEIAQQ